MRYLWFFWFLLFTTSGFTQPITVTNVKVSVTDASSATAREKALDQAHSLAFQKLVEENFPDKAGATPPQETLMNMVTTFSIDKEKTSSKSYTASLSFEFDGPQVLAWLNKSPSPSLPSAAPSREAPLKITTTYDGFSDWHFIKKTLEALPGIVKVDTLSLSPNEATISVLYGGTSDKLQQELSQQGLTLTHQEGDLRLSQTAPSPLGTLERTFNKHDANY